GDADVRRHGPGRPGPPGIRILSEYFPVPCRFDCAGKQLGPGIACHCAFLYNGGTAKEYGPAMTRFDPLDLHVPEPPVRPGDTPDFSNVRIPRAGTVDRPPVDAPAESIRDLAFSIIRVLNRDGEAVGPWAGTLTPDELLEGLRHMMLLRTFDRRMLMAQRQGKTSFYMQHMGEEAVSCAFRM